MPLKTEGGRELAIHSLYETAPTATTAGDVHHGACGIQTDGSTIDTMRPTKNLKLYPMRVKV